VDATDTAPPTDFAPYNDLLRSANAKQAAFKACGVRFVGGVVGMLMLWALLFAYGARRRYAMRKMFGLPGSACADTAAWCCCCWAAICQEARTLRHNRVTAGVWPPAATGTAGGGDHADTEALLPPSRGKALEMERHA
jgi:Cys-rich protein (TIGR01571 family)